MRRTRKYNTYKSNLIDNCLPVTMQNFLLCAEYIFQFFFKNNWEDKRLGLESLNWLNVER